MLHCAQSSLLFSWNFHFLWSFIACSLLSSSAFEEVAHISVINSYALYFCTVSWHFLILCFIFPLYFHQYYLSPLFLWYVVIWKTWSSFVWLLLTFPGTFGGILSNVSRFTAYLYLGWYIGIWRAHWLWLGHPFEGSIELVYLEKFHIARFVNVCWSCFACGNWKLQHLGYKCNWIEVGLLWVDRDVTKLWKGYEEEISDYELTE